MELQGMKREHGQIYQFKPHQQISRELDAAVRTIQTLDLSKTNRQGLSSLVTLVFAPLDNSIATTRLQSSLFGTICLILHLECVAVFPRGAKKTFRLLNPYTVSVTSAENGPQFPVFTESMNFFHATFGTLKPKPLANLNMDAMFSELIDDCSVGWVRSSFCQLNEFSGKSVDEFMEQIGNRNANAMARILLHELSRINSL